MIYISQGHEFGIGLEVFLKSYLCFSDNFKSQFVLVSFNSTLERHLTFLDIKFKICKNHLEFDDGSLLKTIYLKEDKSDTQTSSSLKHCLDHLRPSDILLTLPSSKDQFFYNGSIVSGHTEFFRKYYNQQNIGMSFLSEDTNVLLLTDHISIDNIINNISVENIITKMYLTLSALQEVRNITDIYFSGINPHCGEDGIISNSDQVISLAILKLRTLYPKIVFHDMLPGDTIHFQMVDAHQLFVYAFHDQGLAPFKLKYGLSGINFTTGLPFKRVSVDHGTSFHLFGKNTAQYSGMLYLLSELEKWA